MLCVETLSAFVLETALENKGISPSVAQSRFICCLIKWRCHFPLEQMLGGLAHNFPGKDWSCLSSESFSCDRHLPAAFSCTHRSYPHPYHYPPLPASTHFPSPIPLFFSNNIPSTFMLFHENWGGERNQWGNEVAKSFVSDPGVSWLLPASIKPW